MSGVAVADLLEVTAGVARDAEVPPTVDECEQMLRSCDLVIFEVRGLADRLRAACVNNTPQPVPVKPLNPPPKPQPKPQPQPQPKPGGGK